jgi:hypothetical protein
VALLSGSKKTHFASTYSINTPLPPKMASSNKNVGCRQVPKVGKCFKNGRARGLWTPIKRRIGYLAMMISQPFFQQTNGIIIHRQQT